MPYVTSVERLGFERGKHEGHQEGQLQEARDAVMEVVAARYGAVPDDVRAAVQRLDTLEALHALLRQAAGCPTLEALRAYLRQGQP